MVKKNKIIFLLHYWFCHPVLFKLGLPELGDESLEMWHHFEKLIEKFWKNEPSFPNQHQKSLFSSGDGKMLPIKKVLQSWQLESQN